jgi:hypothetical protein
MKKQKPNLNERIKYLARKHFNTDKLEMLTPQQLDKLTNWATNTNPETFARQKGRKYSGNTYKKIKKIF